MIQSRRRVLVFALLSFVLLAPLAGAGAPERPSRGGREVFIVELAGPPLALSQPRSRGERKLDPGSEKSRRYLEHLRQGQDEALAAARASVGREVAALRQYTRAFNGMALELSKEEADRISRLPGVVRVQPDVKLRLQSDSGLVWIGAPGLWDGTQTGGLPGTKGEGVVIGIVDTGINMDHPSFADIGGDGYNHTNPRGAGNYVGWCNPSNAKYDPALVCNDKLIGVWSFGWSTTPEDAQGHGTQLASVAAGNVVNVPVTASLVRTISGAAPHANLIAYNACGYYGYCYSSEVLAAIDQAIDDGVDVLNVSFAGDSYSPWTDPVSLALLSAREAGVFVASAAGNGGSYYYYGSISSPASAPWLLAVGASTHNRRFSSSFTGLGGGATPPPIAAGLSWTTAVASAPVVKAGGTGDCYSSYPAGTFAGKIVACMVSPHESGQSAVDVVKAAGGLGVVLVDDHTHPEDLKVPMSYNHPAVHLVDDANIAAFWNWMASGAGQPGASTRRPPESTHSTRTWCPRSAATDRARWATSCAPTSWRPGSTSSPPRRMRSAIMRSPKARRSRAPWRRARRPC